MISNTLDKAVEANNSCCSRKVNLTTNIRGSVMAEFIVIVGFVLLPLAIGIMFIGKYIDNKQKMELANRYNGWERTVWYQQLPPSLEEVGNVDTKKSANEIGFEVQNRIFSHKDSGIYLAQKTQSVIELPDPMSESFWVDGSNNAISIYQKTDEIFVTVSESSEGEMYGYTAGIMSTFLNVINALSGSFDVDLAGAITSNVSVTLLKPEFLSDVLAGDISVNKSYTILAEGWNAAGAEHAKLRSQGLVLSSMLDIGALNTVRNFLSIFPMAKEIKSDSLIFGHVVVDAVPEIRLKPYVRR